jgi:hypothetical protein
MRNHVALMNTPIRRVLKFVSPLLVAISLRGASPETAAKAEVMFDDFSYARVDEMPANGWCLRTKPGWPGIPGAHWGPEALASIDDPAGAGNRLLRMTAFTDGTGANTQQAQLCHQRKYRDGTYAARVRFTDKPVVGPAGDQIVETFYLISPLIHPMDPSYSEVDFEYLAAGGWGSKGPTLFGTTWFTFSPEPNWKKDNTFNTKRGSLDGWHVLVAQVNDGKVRYFLDGKKFAEHGGKYYPRVMMSLNFNLWFVKEAVAATHERREYQEDIDWVYFEKALVAPRDIEAKVAKLRSDGVKFRDTVVAPNPPLASPCDF